ncbi:MAG: hypothetical protein ACAI38_08920 [Myxococcota bacterium]|nr:hypothetical protein [Myxococcota bacterium]
MKRLFSLFLLMIFAACGNHPSQTPNAGDPNDEHTQNQFDTSEDPAEANAPSWRYAQPPPGTPRDLSRDEDTRGDSRSKLGSNQAPRPAEPRMEERAPAPTSSPSSANKSAPAKDYASSEGEAARGRGAGGGGDKSDSGAAPMAKRSLPQQQDDRPGLGTTWGETRYSAVNEVHFERDGESPSYTAVMHYNDHRGASALAGYSTSSRSAAIGLGSALTMSVRDEYGNNLSAVRGNGRTVAVGENGQRYTIVVDNNTNERFEVVLSVDGLDVLDGREAAYGKRGYLIEPYGHLEVEGFRQSDDAVAAFRFGSVRDSYAARTGQGRNVGVIGAAAFGERGYRARLLAYQERLNAIRYQGGEVERRRNADPFPGRYATPPQWTVAR